MISLPTTHCTGCLPGCDTCTNGTACATCPGLNVLSLAGLCVSTCPSGSFLPLGGTQCQGTCMLWFSTNAGGIVACTLCQRTRFLWSNTKMATLTQHALGTALPVIRRLSALAALAGSCSVWTACVWRRVPAAASSIQSGACCAWVSMAARIVSALHETQPAPQNLNAGAEERDAAA